MTISLRTLGCLCSAIAIAGAAIGCGDDNDDTDNNAQTGSDASVSEAGGAGRRTAGSGGSRASGGRTGGATAGTGAIAGTGATAGTGAIAGRGVPPVGVGGRSASGGTGGSQFPGGNAGSDAGARLSDAQILAVTTAANTGEIQLGAIALSNARLASVREFAQQLITAHSTAQERQTGLAQSLRITPVQNSVSTQLEQEAARIGVMLQQAAADTFDVSYVQSQVDIHTRVLALFDDLLLPNVTEISLRTDLTITRGDVQDHLTRAQALLAIVEQTPIDADAGVEDAGK